MKHCPNCNGDLVTVGGRAWCVSPYREGGCAGYWTRRGNAWTREAWHTPLLVYSKPETTP